MTWQLLQGACEQILPTLDAGKFQLVHLDPPYFPGAAFDHKQRQSILDWNLLAKECERVLVKGGAIILWGNQPRLMDHYQRYFQPYFRVQGELIWHKSSPNLVISRRKAMPQHENIWILLRHKDPIDSLNLYRTAKQRPIGGRVIDSTTRGGPRHTQNGSYARTRSKTTRLMRHIDKPTAAPINVPHNLGVGHYLSTVITTRVVKGGHPEYLGHPTQKALDIMRPLISLTTKPNDWILDPFAGSGSTLLAAEMLGRNSVGVELNPEFCRLTRERLEAWNR